MSLHSTDKLAARAVKTVFVGYPVHQKGYTLYDPVTHIFHVSRHVIFDETQFPFATIQHTTPAISVSDNAYSNEYDTPLDVFLPNNSSPVPTIDHSTDPPSSSNGPSLSSSPPSLHRSPTQFSDVTPTSDPLAPSPVAPPTLVAPPQRVSLRHKIQPSWMKDYHLDSSSSSISASSVLQSCPINSQKFSFHHYS
ncbi:hypothetical protein POM88_035917 [Heracleum sosnowskyi]|uniref:Retroviral polymerase SH3-like domain-containing protein n=1 Tax=Heracleum sosnowskyi TaxID=360622 RepID=A0AAD8MBY6_9APIA|nr:hypothetical protein POM88_035917 [Heracleum sosnowskyi]